MGSVDFTSSSASSSRGGMVAKSNLARKGSERGKGSDQLRGIKGDGARHGPLELDRVIHERMRLAIVSALAVN